MAIAKEPLIDDAQQPEQRSAREPSIVVDLFKAHARRVQNFLAFRLRDPVEAQDVAQDVFLKLWRHESEGRLRDEATNYMYSPTQSAAIDSDRHREFLGRDRSD